MSNKNEQGGMDVRQKNVYDKPLHQHSNPRTGSSSLSSEPSLKTGYCNEQAPIAAIMTNSFLDFSASKGVDLRKHGLQEGQRLCVESARWKEASDRPGVTLASTHVSALDGVSLGELKDHEAPHDASYTIWPSDRPGSKVGREAGEIGGKEPKA